MSQAPPSQPPPGPPYAPHTAGLGGIPSVIPDVPISAVLLAIYLAFGVLNMVILQVNMKRGHKFFISGALFGFCMSRIVTFVLRIAWATRPHHVRLAIASNVFANAGVLIAYVVNLIFAQRILRARQPTVGWHPSIGVVLRVFFVGIAVALILVIYSVVQASYTLDPSLLRAVRDIQLAAVTYLLVFTTLPLWLLLVAHFLLPKSADAELFGHGSMRSKVLINVLSTCLAVLIAGFKTGAAWEPPRPLSNPAWYQGKAAFYVFNFVLEVSILALMTFTRVDKRFHVPDGSKKPGDYTTRGKSQSGEEGAERAGPAEPEKDETSDFSNP